MGHIPEGERCARETLEQAQHHNAIGATGWAYLVLAFLAIQQARWMMPPISPIRLSNSPSCSMTKTYALVSSGVVASVLAGVENGRNLFASLWKLYLSPSREGKSRWPILSVCYRLPRLISTRARSGQLSTI